MMEKKKLMVIGEKENFIIRVLLNKLQGARISGLFVPADLSEIAAHWDEAFLVAYYLEKDEVIPDEIRTFLIDHLADDHKQVILIGEPVDTSGVMIPGELVYEIMTRPLDYDAFASAVDSYEEKRASGELKKSILIVDDDPQYMNLVREWLKEDYRVSMVTSGLRAMKWLGADNPVDLILLDYEMPVVDGPQVLEMLRSESTTKHIPVIFLTGNDDKDSVMSVMSLHPQGYILKTVSQTELIHKIKTFFLEQK